MPLSLRLLPLFLAVLCISPVFAQDLPQVPADACRSEMDARLAFGLCLDGTFDFFASGAYREDVPRPDDVFGYPIGSWHTTYGRMERYLGLLREAVPERVVVFEYGRSVEHQVMHLVAVSSESNIARIEDIRVDLQRLADPRATSPEEAAEISARTPVVVWLNAANDGNETAAFEAAIVAAYQLAAGEDERTRRLRDDVLVLVNLAHNPESHERHVAWYNAFVQGDAHPVALEHRAPWGMSTNNNHYQIDLNRDALGLTQTESRAVAAALQHWRPQVFVDLHGQTTQYFFPPAAIPVNPIYPEQLGRWLDVIGRGNAEAFDQFGWSYYTRDVFDLYYPGYWDTYPGLHGATGMTYETDGGGSKGVRWRRDDGTILTFADGIAHHFVASMATIETAAQHREARLLDYYDFFASALAEARGSDLRGVALLSDGPDDRQAAFLATTLLRHGLEVERVTQGGAVNGRRHGEASAGSVDVPAGSFYVPFDQPNYRLARTLLAPSVELPEGFRRQELQRLARNMRRAPGEQESYTFYDVTAWSLPLAMGVPAVAVSARPALGTEPVALPEGFAKAAGGWETDVALPVAGGVDGRARSAYVWEASSTGAYRLLARLLDEGFAVAVAERPLVVDGRDFARGTFIARVGRNPEALHHRIAALAAEAGVAVTPARTAFPERGPTGTGSESTRSLSPPRVAVLAGEDVSITSYGALWFYLERRLRQPFTAIRTDDLGEADLDAFDVLVLPHGSYGGLGDEKMERVREWVERGGLLVGYAGGARFLQRQELARYAPADTSEWTDEERAALVAEVDRVAGETTLPPATSPSARPEDPMAAEGAFLRALVDRTHWLTHGYETDVMPLLASSLPLRSSERGANPVVYASGDLVASGFAWPHATERTYGGRAYVTVDEVGEGRLVLFAEDPLFRIVFDAPARLLWNAIYLGARGRRAADAY